MSRQFLIQPEAKEDIQEAAKLLEGFHLGTGLKFLKLIEKYFELIAANPLLFGILFENVRAVTIPKYKYVVVYRIRDDRTDVLAVVHGARDASSWKSRLD